MKIPRGNAVTNVPMKTETEFIAAAQSPLFAEGAVFAIETGQDWTSLIRILSSTVRPFAVCVIAPK